MGLLIFGKCGMFCGDRVQKQRAYRLLSLCKSASVMEFFYYFCGWSAWPINLDRWLQPNGIVWRRSYIWRILSSYEHLTVASIRWKAGGVMPNLSFDQKYSNSYGACVSSITSYRRKRCVRNDEFAEVEKDLLRNIQECKSLLAEHDERCRNTPTGRNDEELITNIPVLRAMKNVVLLDRDRMLQRAISTWKEFTCAKRQIENRVNCWERPVENLLKT